MKSSRPWILYSMLRIGIFVVVFGALALLGVDVVFSAILAAIVGLCVSYIFLRGPREELANSVAEWRKNSHKDDDNEAENELLDAEDGRADAASVVPTTPMPIAASEGERGAQPDTEEKRGEAGQL